MPGEGGRAGRLGALVVGFYEDGELRYAGRVGTGFNEAELKRVQELLEPLARETARSAGRQQPEKGTRSSSRSSSRASSTRPRSRATARCATPSYKGLRDDIAPEDVSRPE